MDLPMDLPILSPCWLLWASFPLLLIAHYHGVNWLMGVLVAAAGKAIAEEGLGFHNRDKMCNVIGKLQENVYFIEEKIVLS